MMWSNSYWPNYWSDVYWPSAEAVGEEIDLCPPFRLYKRDCELEVREWSDRGAYMRVSPFGGPHYEKPSGAEI